jgi:hypothetical protein
MLGLSGAEAGADAAPLAPAGGKKSGVAMSALLYRSGCPESRSLKLVAALLMLLPDSRCGGGATPRAHCSGEGRPGSSGAGSCAAAGA